jgi:hypothetical protein
MPYDALPGSDVLAGPDGSWSAGRVVTLVVPLARALARLHAEGLVHGAVGRYAVRCTAEGRPEFADEQGRRARSSEGESADVRALARLGLQLLDRSGADADKVRVVLEATVAGRLDASTLADRLTSATRAEPLLAVPRPATRSHRREPRRSRRGLLAALVGLAGVVALVVAAFVRPRKRCRNPLRHRTAPLSTVDPWNRLTTG